MKLSKAAYLAGAVALTAFVCGADDTPIASNVTMTQQQPGRLVTITYQLDNAPAVVTLDVQTNYTENGVTKWASIGGKAVCNAQGDVWKKVGTAGSTFNGTIKWRPDLSWEGHLIPSGGARAVVMAWALDNTPDYMVVDISRAARPNTQLYYPAADFVPNGVSNSLYKTTTLLMRKVMAKNVTWTMGSTDTEPGYKSASEGTHQVALTNNYYIGVYEVTQSQWSQIATNSSISANFTTERSMRPMEKVSYNEIRLKANSAIVADNDIDNYSWPKDPASGSFLGLLRLKTDIDFDLPSEAQWEFAARSGNGVGSWGDGSEITSTSTDGNLNRLGRYLNNPASNSSQSPDENIASAVGGTAIVGSYEPNAWGLYDMHGNVNEWCLDWYQDNIATAEDVSNELYGGRVNIDPSNPRSYLSGVVVGTKNRAIRGGCWRYGAGDLRAARRLGNGHTARDSYVGFRVVCTAGLQ